jgi:hypothetical protein
MKLYNFADTKYCLKKLTFKVNFAYILHQKHHLGNNEGTQLPIPDDAIMNMYSKYRFMFYRHTFHQVIHI